MSSDIAQFLWVEGALSTMEKLCLRSFLQNGYVCHLYTYKPVSGVPTGVQVFPAQNILSEEFVVKTKSVTGASSSYTATSDLFRLELLFQRGGWWFDMDMICLQYISAPSDFRVASTWELAIGECACNCAIWAEKGDARIEELRDNARYLIEEKGSNLAFAEAGVFPLHDLLRRYSLQANVAPWWEFCPYPWRMVYRLAQRSAKEFCINQLRGIKHRAWERIDPMFKAGYPRSGSRTLHFHNEIWKSVGLGKDESFFFMSPIEVLKRRYLQQEPS